MPRGMQCPQPKITAGTFRPLERGLKQVSLEGAEELFGLGEGQPEMLDALMVLVEGEDIGDGLFITLII